MKTRTCAACGDPKPFAKFSNARWNAKRPVCCDCKPFVGSQRLARQVSRKIKDEMPTGECPYWPAGAKIMAGSWPRFCAATRKRRAGESYCCACKIKGIPGNVGVL